MQLLSKISVLFGLIFASQVQAQNNEVFRTPARQYAGAISVKMQFKKGFTDYDVPMWIKPDQAESTLDPVLMKDFGYEDKILEFDLVKMSGELLEKKRFKPMKSEWAIVPDFAKSCCHGVIGRDILDDFEIQVVPGTPAHIVWRRLISKPATEPMKTAFLGELKKLFSLSGELDRSFVLNLQERSLKFEGESPKHSPALFSFFIVPPDRDIQITAFSPKVESAAKKVGFSIGSIVTELNDQQVGKLDRWLVEKYLRGEKTPTVKLETRAKKVFTFDFKTQKFQ